MPTPQADGRAGIQAPCVRLGESMTPGQASLFDSLLSLADDTPDLPYTPKSPESSVVGDPSAGEHIAGTQRSAGSGSYSRAEHTVNRLEDIEDIDGDDPEYLLEALLNDLVLDREVESNLLPFVAQSFMAWMNRFMFEPIRAISLARDMIIRGHSGNEARRNMILVANAALAVSESTFYEFTHFTALYKHLVKHVLEARACSELTKEAAIKVLGSCHELISLTCKVGSLASVLNLMDLYAPIFRRACPESDGLVNLPRRLAAVEVNLKYFVSFDVLLSVITHRPMLFRYGFDFLSPQDEELLNEDDEPGMRWSIGIPARLVVVLAKMNILLESYGNCVDQETLRDLKEEVGSCKSVISSSPGDDPTLTVGKLMVQESWKLAGYVYFYMGLCGANSDDARVVKVQKRFMGLLETVKPRRNPDLFLVLPILIMGVATSSSADRFTLLARLWGVSECSKPGTMGNDVIRMLNDIWAHTVEKPAVWLDLRTTCLRVVGM
ncbi:unnamed protein product [Rhizoctonia solani]|uniref:Fungal-specific transcription factor domain protein n=1 Tax=Rhizoctonia solani TaxID=456999 RepID=A0A8H3BVJ1_9AGAM|nr:unnamed protein product [Rhizoctonia solani]